MIYRDWFRRYDPSEAIDVIVQKNGVDLFISDEMLWRSTEVDFDLQGQVKLSYSKGILQSTNDDYILMEVKNCDKLLIYARNLHYTGKYTFAI